MKFLLRSPDQVLLERDHIISFSATLLDERRITILQNHAPVLAVVKAGEIQLRDRKTEESLSIQQSILKFRKNQITLYCEDAVSEEEMK